MIHTPAETLLLDLEAVVVLQNELQRLCLVAASLLVVQQVGVGGWAAGLCTLFASAPLAAGGGSSFRALAGPASMALCWAGTSGLHTTGASAPSPPLPQILAAQRALPPSGSPRHAALCQRLVRRVGLLLSSGANLEALAVELHSQIEQEMAAAGAEQQAAAGTAGSGEGAAASSSAASGSSGGGGACPVELATVRRMIEGIFSTSHTVYQRVQVGFLLGRASWRAWGMRAQPVAAAGSSGCWNVLLLLLLLLVKTAVVAFARQLPLAAIASLRPLPGFRPASWRRSPPYYAQPVLPAPRPAAAGAAAQPQKAMMRPLVSRRQQQQQHLQQWQRVPPGARCCEAWALRHWPLKCCAWGPPCTALRQSAAQWRARWCMPRCWRPCRRRRPRGSAAGTEPILALLLSRWPAQPFSSLCLQRCQMHYRAFKSSTNRKLAVTA